MANRARRIGDPNNNSVQFDAAGDLVVTLETGNNLDLGVIKIWVFSTAITTAVTTVPAGSAAGDIALTTHVTGRDKTFYSNGTVWTAKT